MKELLEDLGKAVGCEYLSDLRSRSFWPSLARALESLPAEEYDAEEWRRALRYITDTNLVPDRPEALRARLLEKICT